MDLILPDEIRGAIKAIDYDLRYEILELLYKKGSMSFTDLLNELKIKKGSLSYHLDILSERGLLDNYSGDDFSDIYRSYYILSKFGKNFLNNLFSVFEYTYAVSSGNKKVIEINEYENVEEVSLNVEDFWKEDIIIRKSELIKKFNIDSHIYNNILLDLFFDLKNPVYIAKDIKFKSKKMVKDYVR